VRALVLGATGTMGRAVSAELVRNSEIDGLVVASRSIERAEWAAQSLGGAPRGIRAVAIDVRDEEAARRAFDSSGCDVIVSSAGPAQETERSGVLAAVHASIPWASLCDDHLVTEELWALRDEIAAGGVPVVSGCGLSPGITNLLVTLATAEIDEVEEIDISLALSSSDLRGDASAQQFLVGLDRQAPMVSDHEPSVQPAPGAPRLTYFPEPVGWVETFPQGRPEVVTLPRRHPQLRSLQIRAGLVEKAFMDLARMAAAAGAARTGVLRRLSLLAVRPLRRAAELLPPGGAGWTAARVDVRGTAAGRSHTTSLAVVDHLTNLAAQPLVAAALSLGSRSAAMSGLCTVEEAFDSSVFLSRLTQRGVRIARLEPYPL
jgi:saccharopine dehydrogenase-like NADP-dependent oxidoreductase